MKKKKKANFLVFWIGQSVSQLGSATTSFALTIWVFEQSQSAMAVSLIILCSYLPYILVSILSGGIVDKFSKKTILIASDTIAAICTIGIAISMYAGTLSVW